MSLQPKPLEKEYETVEEYLQEQLNMVYGAHNKFLEDSRKYATIIEDLQKDLKVITTPELKNIAENMIKKHEELRKQALEFVKRSRKDLGFINQLYKKWRS